METSAFLFLYNDYLFLNFHYGIDTGHGWKRVAKQVLTLFMGAELL